MGPNHGAAHGERGKPDRPPDSNLYGGGPGGLDWAFLVLAAAICAFLTVAMLSAV